MLFVCCKDEDGVSLEICCHDDADFGCYGTAVCLSNPLAVSTA